MKLHFLGANRQVTGSSTLLQAGGLNVLVDRGMFQERAFDGRNDDALPIPAAEVDHVILTHAHLDHCGLLPKLVRDGFRGPIHTHHASAELAELVMLDSARLQEEDEDDRPGREHGHAEAHGPLYDEDDARRACGLFEPVGYDVAVQLNEHVGFVLRDAGHILGSASVQIACRDGDDGPAKRIVFSGDLGQDDRPIIEDPEGFAAADVLVLESTYGDREHGKAGDATAALERIVNRTHADGGKLIIPSFAIERAQELLYHFNTLKNEKRIGTLKVFLDSPMAAKATQVFKTNPQVLDDEAVETLREDDDLFDFPGLYVTRSRRQSMAINGLREPAVIIAGSGMCTGGRVVHHLKRYLDEPEHCVLFVGYQAHGTPGRDIQKYGPRGGFVQLGGRRIDIRCRIETLHGMSGHADRNGLRDWLAGFEDRPRRVFLNHGDEEAAAALAGDIRKQLPRAEVAVPAYREVVEL